jgi:glycosyltransferase involved in cell wall biosynthesis
MKVAIVHDWMTRRGGAERVLVEMHKIWPDAPIYTAIYEPREFPEFCNADIRTTWLNRIALARRKHQLFSIPRSVAYAMLDLRDFDVVISSCSAESKYVRTGRTSLHICYCYTPTRYYWSDYDFYRAHPPFGPVLSALAKYLVLPLLLPLLRWFDYRMAQRVTTYVTQSKYIQNRIKKYYGRDSELIHPPVNVEKFTTISKEKDDYFLIVGRQVAYKRLDLAVAAFNKLGLRLVIAGTGEDVPKQREIARSNIEFKGFVPEADLPQLYANARAVIYPQEEDFGLVPVEAMAAGTPVIAYGVGGAAETVLDERTGVLFSQQTPEALIEAVEKFKTMNFNATLLRQHAQNFSAERFRREFKSFVEAEYARFRKNRD